jgi:hypothetical protein
MVLSPYLDIIDEYRVLVLNDEPLCIYKKKRMLVVGDGKSSLLQLILNQINQVKLRDRIIRNLLDGEDLNKILGGGEKYLVS